MFSCGNGTSHAQQEQHTERIPKRYTLPILVESYCSFCLVSWITNIRCFKTPSICQISRRFRAGFATFTNSPAPMEPLQRSSKMVKLWPGAAPTLAVIPVAYRIVCVQMSGPKMGELNSNLWSRIQSGCINMLEIEGKDQVLWSTQFWGVSLCFATLSESLLMRHELSRLPGWMFVIAGANSFVEFMSIEEEPRHGAGNAEGHD